MRRIPSRSAPAEKLLPAPRRTTARTDSSSPRPAKQAVMRAISASSKALCSSGRLSVTVATPRASMLWSRVSVMSLTLHPEQAEFTGFDRRVERGREAEPQHHPRLGRVDHPGIPQPRAGKIGMALGFVLRPDRRLELLFLFGGPGLAGGLEIVAAPRRQYRGGLFASHHADPGIGPHPQEARLIGPPAHAVITGAETAADDDREFRHIGRRHCRHHLGAVLGDAAGLVFPPNHEAGDFFQ